MNPSASPAKNLIDLPSERKARRAHKKEKYYLIAGILSLVIVVAGFFPTYITPIAAGSFVAKPFVHFHGIIFFLWILAGIMQPLLVYTGNTRLHRKTGVAFSVLALGVLIMGITMAIISAKVDMARGDLTTPRAFLLIPLTDMMLFAIFAGLGIWWYKRPQYHKRLMLLATVAILPAPFARLFGIAGLENVFFAIPLMNLLLFGGVINDFVYGRRPHAVYLLGGALLLGVQFSRIPLSETQGWMSIADWILH